MKKLLFIVITMTLGVQLSATAQESEYEKPNWYFGAAAGANFNFYRGTTQQLNADLTVPTAFHDGEGTGLYIAPLVEYHFTNSVWGIMLQAGYDNRQGKWDQVMSPCDCPMDLSSDLSYLTIEPSIRLAPFKSGFYLYAGPRFAFTMDESFSYQKGTNADYPEQVADPERNEDFDRMESSVISMQVGAGYDIALSSRDSRSQFVLSPFVSFQPYFGQYPRSVESWNITTVRAGAALKFGRGRQSAIEEVEAVLPVIGFSIDSPRNLPGERSMTETFPLSNYVFFDQESTEIPARYVQIDREDTGEFKEDQVEMNPPDDFSGRSKREMKVYYNILNILGDRMEKNPNSSITLVGSAQSGPAEGEKMAASVKDYLVNVFAIQESRIALEGRKNPKIPSEKPGGTRELDLLREGDRRVSIESSSPALLMEFQTGPKTALKPVELNNNKALEASAVTFKADGAEEAFSSWTLQLTDNKGKVQSFGPYTEEEVKIAGEDILGNASKGDYKVQMIGTTPTGEVVTEESTVTVTKWTPSENSEANRFSILFEFDDANAIAMYEKYLIEVVTPKIPKNGEVVIHGYTDVIGEMERNQELSLARANEVRSIIENALAEANRDDVSFVVRGSGEDEVQAPFGNKMPEERAYNRTVIIDLGPAL